MLLLVSGIILETVQVSMQQTNGLMLLGLHGVFVKSVCFDTSPRPVASRQARPPQKVKKIDSVAAPSGNGKKKRLAKVHVSCFCGLF